MEKGEKVVSLAARRATPSAGTAAEARREPDWLECDACGSPLQTLGHCKYLCRLCGFMRTCMDTV
ncbi:MAG: hypothetical protein ACKO2K_21880 [Alphaproteobacteria bacterium]